MDYKALLIMKKRILLFLNIKILFFLLLNLSASIDIEQKKETKTIDEDKKINFGYVKWIDPVFINKTPLEIFYIRIDFKTKGKTSTLIYGSKNNTGTKEYIKENQKIKIKGTLVFTVLFTQIDTDLITKVGITIKGIHNRNDICILKSSFDYSAYTGDNKSSFWNTVKEIPSGSPSYMTISYDAEKHRFVVDAIFKDNDDKNKNLEDKYFLSFYMIYESEGRKTLTL